SVPAAEQSELTAREPQPAEAPPPADGTPPPAENTPPPADDTPPPAVAPQPRPTNRLARETSPYLLMHAHNPVDWYPWGEEALAKAKRENKIIFLSVGYSSCHWCHVMERESFLDREIAAYLNEHFVCIKVDREERPDVDSIYMMAVQIISGRGGWPMSVFLTPDARPFFGGTYFPARDNDRPGITGFLSLIQMVQKVWAEQPDDLRRDAERLTALVKNRLDGRPPGAIEPLNADWLDQVQQSLAEQFDPTYGGFGYVEADPQRPKFPEASNLLFLIDRLRRLPDERSEARDEARRMLDVTLGRLAMGGIRDHLGGGFHRYSVDRYWQIPHFEKMLYDNGQLASVYSEAYALTGNAEYRQVVEELADFVLREMTSPGGAFYSALDAESEHVEGKFYRWEMEQVEELLGADGFALLAGVYGLDAEANFEEQFYVPQLSQPFHELAEARQLTAAELHARLAPLRQRLLEARNQRPRPLTDDKILTSWNGLMIRGLADAGRLLREPRYVAAAERAARFVMQHLRDQDGRLLRTYGQGQARLNAYLNDYAFLVDGLIGLHLATGDQEWLAEARRLTDKQLELFWDEKEGGFYFTSGDHESLLARIRDPLDGAQPAGNSVAAQNLLYLAAKLNEPAYRQRAERTIQAISGWLRTAPSGSPRMAVAVAEWLETAPQPAESK
ncbi:MAG: thioredoxin domain-containing protein, partial [Pirellulaceae bacterium]|nr:thioredoxin domain-containing protein [Pirellulaceae bacterium]